MRWKQWLLVASVALNVGLLIGLFSGPLLDDASAQNRTTASTGSGFVLAAGGTKSSQQMLCVADTRSKRMIVYAPQPTGGPLKVIDARNLVNDFGPDFTGDIIMLPFQISSSLEAVAVIDTVNRRMITYVSANQARLSIIDSRNLATDFTP